MIRRVHVLNINSPGGKINFQRTGIMKPAQICNQHTVNKNPDVIISGKFKTHGLLVR